MKKTITRIPKHLQAIVVAIAVAAIGLTAVGGFVFAGGSTPEVYLGPSSGTYTVGSDLAVQIRENSNGTAVNSVQAGISYPASLQFTSVDTTGTVFGNNVSPTSYPSGEVVVSLFSSATYTTDELVATVHFKVLSAATAPINFTTSCQSSATGDCTGLGSSGSTIAITTSGGSYTLQSASSGGTGSGGSSGGSGSTGPSGGSTTVTTHSSSSTTATTKSNSTSITPKSSSAPITAPNNSSVQVSTPVSVEPATVQPDGVKDVKYYLNKKLLYTASTPPYAYNLDTTNVLNGTYNFTTLTEYNSGRTKSVSQQLIIKNPLSFTQVRLFVHHYAVEFIVPPILILVAVYFWFFRGNWGLPKHRPHPGAPTTGMMPPPPNNYSGPTIIKPSSSSTSAKIEVSTPES